MLNHNLENRNSLKKKKKKKKETPDKNSFQASSLTFSSSLPLQTRRYFAKTGHGLDSISCSTRSEQQEAQQTPNTNTSSPNNTQAAGS